MTQQQNDQEPTVPPVLPDAPPADPGAVDEWSDEGGATTAGPEVISNPVRDFPE